MCVIKRKPRGQHATRLSFPQDPVIIYKQHTWATDRFFLGAPSVFPHHHQTVMTAFLFSGPHRDDLGQMGESSSPPKTGLCEQPGQTVSKSSRQEVTSHLRVSPTGLHL